MVLLLVMDVAKPAEVVDLPLAQDVFQVPTAPGDMTIRVVEATGRPRLLLIPLYGDLPVRLLSVDSTSGAGSTESFGVREDPPLSDVFDGGAWWRRVASPARAKPSVVVRFFARQWRTTRETLHTGTGQQQVPGWRWGYFNLLCRYH